MSDRAYARNVVERIAGQYRLLGQAHANRLNSVDDTAGPFIEQLLRYADGRTYTSTRTAAEGPSIDIDARPGRVIIEYNSDRLLERDILPLCGRRGDQDGQALPEGSIRWEPAFRDAWKVSLQSGDFSFYFGQPTAHVLIPIWHEPGDRHPGNKTRITLHLQRREAASSATEAWADLVKQIQELQPNHLLFLRQLRRMKITVRNEDGETVTANNFQLRRCADDVVTVSALFGSADGTLTHESHYLITRSRIQDALGDQNEENSWSGGVKDGSLEVVLAFPIDGNSSPVMEPQELYSFYPLGKFGFKFLIQCDLITEATTIYQSLLDGIATAVIESIQSLCQHPKLCYSWPRFLPLPGESTDHPLSGLAERIKDRLRQAPVLRPFHNDELRLVQQVRLCTPEELDQDGTPLFGDAALDPYLSRNYGEQDLAILQGYGLRSTDIGEILTLVQTDLENPNSKMKSNLTSRDWRSRAASLLLRNLSQGDENHLALVAQLDLIPLRNGSWCSAASGPIYWPTTQDIYIPGAFDGRIVDNAAASSPERRLLLQYLGVQETPISDVRSWILTKNKPPGQITVSECRDELRFLYMTHRYRQADEDLKHVIVLDQSLKPVWPQAEDVYLPGISQYSPEELFRSTKSEDGSDDAPGFPASFLHPDILGIEPEQPGPLHPTWRRWLVYFLGIRERVRLVSRAGDAISDSFSYIAKHRQRILLDVLEQLWRAEGDLVITNAALLGQVKQVPVPCLSGLPHPLWETYLPLEDLGRRCLQFMEPHEAFPFVDLGGRPSAEELANKWSFLYTHLGVLRNNDVGFLLDILSYVQLANPAGLAIRRCRDVMRLYCELERRCADSMEPNSLRGICRSYIQDIQGIVIPAAFDAPSRWIDSKQCLWGAPLYMTTKFPLQYLYERVCQLSATEQETLSSFFRQTVGVPCVGVQDLILELSTLRDNGCRDLGRVARVYDCLNGLITLETRLELRRLFDNEPLILVASNGQPTWLTLSQCLWSNPIAFPGKPAVDVHYAPLKDFFVQTLGVGLLTMEMVYSRLLQMEYRDPPFAELKIALWLLSSFLETTRPRPSPTPLLKSKVFPVRYPDGSTVLVSAETDFAIVDRNVLGGQFAGYVRLLDFTVEEVTRLKPLLGWLGLTQRYLSACVTDMTFLSGCAEAPISSVNRDLKYKAHALTRIAAAFSSPRYKRGGAGLYEMLRATQVIETSGISSVPSITQDGKVVASQMIVEATVHLADEPGGLRVYVPRDSSAQEICFAAALPRRLGQWLMRDPVTQLDGCVDERLVTTLGAVLSVDIPLVDRVLAHEGIGHIDVLPTTSQGIATAEVTTPWQGTPPGGSGG